MLQKLLRHHRRLGFFSFGMTLFVVSTAIHSQEMKSAGSVISLAIFCLFVTLFAAAAIYKWQYAHRGVLERAGAAGVLSAIILFYIPVVQGLYCLLISSIIFSASFAGIWWLLGSKLSHKIGSKMTWRFRHSSDFQYPAKLVWTHIIPGEAPPKENCTGVVERYIVDPEDEGTIEVVFRGPQQQEIRYVFTFLDKRPRSFCRFHFQGEEPDGTLFDGVFSVNFEVNDHDRCTVIAIEECTGKSLAAQLETWFEDALGSKFDRLEAMLDQLYGDGTGVTKPLKSPRQRGNIVSRVVRF